MTHKHYYITTGTDWDTTTKAFVVAIGTSLRERRVLEALSRYAEDNGDFFKLATAESDEFYHRVLASISDPLSRGILVKGADLLRYFKHGIAPSLSQGSLSAAHQQRYMMNLDYRISCNLAAERGQHCQALNVKNLSK